MKQVNEDSLWLSCRIDGSDYCVQSDYIKSITVSKKIEKMAKSPAAVAGMINFGDKLLGVLEMRELLGSISLKDYIERFSIMKEMHVSWVKDLERYVHDGGEFTKAVDPHQCMFGKWYDNFTTDNLRLNRLLKKVAAPHANIHACGADILRMRAKGSDEALVEKRLADAENICDKEIVPLLDRLIDIYRTINRGVIMVVGDADHDIGLLVDEVKTLIPCRDVMRHGVINGIMHCDYIGDAIVKGDVMMLEIKVGNIMKMQDLANEEQ